MDLKSRRYISLIMTAGSDKADTMIGEKSLDRVFNEIAASAGCSVQHLAKGAAIVPLVQEDLQRDPIDREPADALPSIGGVGLVLFASQAGESIAK